MDSDLLAKNWFQISCTGRDGASSILPNAILIGSKTGQSRAIGEKSSILTLGRVGSKQGLSRPLKITNWIST